MTSFDSLMPPDLTPSQAVALQKELREKVLLHPPTKPIRTVAGADISFDKYSPTLFAGIVVLSLSNLETIEEAGAQAETKFPYIPGLLSFREIPPLLKVWQKLKNKPDVLICDGHGIAHPRRLGIASHLGLLLDVPTLGCGKSVLVGKYDEPALERGSWSPMIHKDEVVGAALRTKNRVKPVYISPGHRMDLETAIEIALACDGGYRLPEPTRRAHLLVNRLRRGED